jgi:hypothetical protein
MRGSGIGSIVVLIVFGLIIADILIPSHLEGSKAAFNAGNTLANTTVGGLLGQAPKQ